MSVHHFDFPQPLFWMPFIAVYVTYKQNAWKHTIKFDYLWHSFVEPLKLFFYMILFFTRSTRLISLGAIMSELKPAPFCNLFTVLNIFTPCFYLPILLAFYQWFIIYKLLTNQQKTGSVALVCYSTVHMGSIHYPLLCAKWVEVI